MTDESASLGGPAASAASAPGLPAAVDRASFQAELDKLRVREKAHTRQGDAIAAARRRLPMTGVGASLTLTGPRGPLTLLEAFEGRRQLIAYYFMWNPGRRAAEQCGTRPPAGRNSAPRGLTAARPPGRQCQCGRAGAPSPSGRGSRPDALTTSAPAMTAVRTTAAAALTATLGLAAACWVVSVWQMTGMDMGVATRLGSFAFFAAVWVAMMAAMMLPGAAPAVARAARAGGVRAVPLFAGSYLAVWALAGAVVFAAYRPHGTAAAGAVTIAAGAYEFTPLKRHFRRSCRETAGSGFGFGLRCVGSSAGLMAMLVVLGVMSVGWMAVIAVLVTAQKLLPPRGALDVPLALAIVALGVLIMVDSSSVPGLTPPM
jgi:predicted metal-binding membrane protein